MALNVRINVRDIQKEIEKEYNKRIRSSLPKIQSVLGRKIEDIVFQKLIGGIPTITGNDLYEMGIPDINNRLTSIIQTISKNVKVQVSTAKTTIKITITILQEDYSDILALPQSVFVYSAATGSGILEWLKWMLLSGNNPVIIGFDYDPAPSVNSRTGGGMMVRGGSWNVPPSLAGSSDDNILTRALNNIEQDIKLTIEREMSRILK